jgi:hypothetical protein
MGALRNLTLAVDSTPSSNSTSLGLISDAFLASSGDHLMLIFSAARQAINTLVGISNNDQNLISALQKENLLALGPQPSSNSSSNHKKSRGKDGEGMAAGDGEGDTDGEGTDSDASVPSVASIYLDCVEIIEHGIAFLWHLSEISEKATELITLSGALPVLLPFLDVRTSSILEKIDQSGEVQTKLRDLRHGGEGR